PTIERRLRECASFGRRSSSSVAVTAPHWEWPSTTTSRVPNRSAANSTLPICEGATTLPATRITKRSPSPWSNTISAGTRESEQPSTIANGSWPVTSSARRVRLDTPSAFRTPEAKRRLPSRSRWRASRAVIGTNPRELSVAGKAPQGSDPGRAVVQHLAELAQQRVRAHGLLEEGEPFVEHAVVDDRVARVAGLVEHAGVRPGPGEGLRERAPAHARHHDVGQQQVDRARERLRHLERGVARPRLEDDVALRLQDLARELPEGFLVLDEEDRLRPRPRRLPHRGLGVRRGGLVDAGQVDLEDRAEAHLAVDPDVALALLHDAVRGSEPQPRSLARRLRGDERLAHTPP